MKLGLFSLSLSVKNIYRSKAFYEKLGFTEFGGDIEQKWLIMKDPDDQVIGLFEGMFETNMLTFNPGWNANAENIEDFIDVRELQQRLIKLGIDCGETISTKTTGPAHFMLHDPDGNPILIDQHR